MNKPQPRIIKEKSGSENLNSKFLIPDSESNPAEDLEKYLNEDMDPAVELAAIGAKVAKKVNSRPRYKPVFAKQKLEFPISNFQFPNESQNTEYEKPDVEYETLPEDYHAILAQINQKITPSDNAILIGEPKRVDVVDWWEEKLKNQNEKIKITESGVGLIQTKPKLQLPKLKLPKVSFPKVKISPKKIIIGGFAVVMFGLLAGYGFFIKNEIVLNGSSAVANLQNAGENIKNLNFDIASTDFTQAYSDFTKAGDNLNFMGATMSSLIADLPGASKLKSAKALMEAGKLMADAGQAMSQAINELAKTGLILNPAGSNISIDSISSNLKQALLLSQKDIKEAGALLADVDSSLIPEERRADFEEFQSKLPQFEKLVNDSIDYTKFLEDFIGISGTKKYLLLFQNPAELRPTGGFPGSYGIVVFKDGKLQDLKVDDIYNLDGQLKELIVPPVQLQHITPNWGMRDANWFVDFPTSARKVSEFYKKESGQDIDGVITFSPTIIAKILKVTGPVEMQKYGVTLNTDNFIQTVQEEVEYKGDRAQPKKILVDLAPLMLEKIYSADSEKWMEIFNIFVSSVDQKDILMYFRDLKLQDFSVTRGFSGQVNQTQDDYLMVVFSNIKGSKTDSVVDSELKINSVFEGDDVRHEIVLTRTHNGGSSEYGFYNKQNSVYVRVLVPDNANFLNISGNSKPKFEPMLNYDKTDFKRDEDLVRFEEKSYYDSETGVTTYEESGKIEYGFWMITNPGETRTVKLEYRVSGKAAGGEYIFYLQKQPGLESNKFTLNFISDTMEIGQSSAELKKMDEGYAFSGKLDKDFPIKIIFK